MRDLRFEAQPDGRQKACVAVEVATLGGAFDFTFDFPLEIQLGDVETAAREARDKLIGVFEGAAADLRGGPLRRG